MASSGERERQDRLYRMGLSPDPPTTTTTTTTTTNTATATATATTTTTTTTTTAAEEAEQVGWLRQRYRFFSLISGGGDTSTNGGGGGVGPLSGNGFSGPWASSSEADRLTSTDPLL